MSSPASSPSDGLSEKSSHSRHSSLQLGSQVIVQQTPYTDSRCPELINLSGTIVATQSSNFIVQ